MKITQVQHSEVSSIKLLCRENESVIATFTFDSSLECYDWKLALRKQIANVVSWKHAFKEKMHIEETKKSRLSVPSTASFYDQIQIEEIVKGLDIKPLSVLRLRSLENRISKHQILSERIFRF